MNIQTSNNNFNGLDSFLTSPNSSDCLLITSTRADHIFVGSINFYHDSKSLSIRHVKTPMSKSTWAKKLQLEVLISTWSLK